jgi:hypothetical protein
MANPTEIVKSFNPNSQIESRPNTPTEPSRSESPSPENPTPKTETPISESSTSLPKKGDIFKPKGKTPEQAPEKPKTIATWLKEIEDPRSDNENRQKLIEKMKQFLYKEHVIKPDNIHQSYWDTQGEIAVNEGRKKDLIVVGGVSIEEQIIQNQDGTRTTRRKFTFPQELKEQKINLVTSNQKQSLDVWIDYLTSDDTIRPMWAKVWILEGVKKIAFHIQEERIKFLRRDKRKIAPFPPLNALALANTITEMHDILKKQSKDKEIQRPDQNEDEIFQDETSHKILSRHRFSKLYAKQLNEAFKDSTTEGLGKTQVKLKKYPQGSDLQHVTKDLKGHIHNWCVGTENSYFGRSYLEEGDIYIGYSYSPNDKPGEPSIPRILVIMKGSDENAKIHMVNGIGPCQELDKDIAPLKEEILKENFGKKTKDYQKKAADMKRVTKLKEKQDNNESFSKENIRFLYQLDKRIKGFGYYPDPRIQEIIEERDIKEDLSLALGIKKNHIITAGEKPNRKAKYYYGELKDMSPEIEETEMVGANLYRVKSVRALNILRKIFGE